MSSLPLELHQVLEEEYVSMYGPLQRPKATYETEDVIDVRWANVILHECGLPTADSQAAIAT